MPYPLHRYQLNRLIGSNTTLKYPNSDTLPTGNNEWSIELIALRKGYVSGVSEAPQIRAVIESHSGFSKWKRYVLGLFRGLRVKN